MKTNVISYITPLNCFYFRKEVGPSLHMKQTSNLSNCACLFHGYVLIRAGSHFDKSICTSINISIRKVRKTCVNRGYISISTSISIYKHIKMEKVSFLALMRMLVLMLM